MSSGWRVRSMYGVEIEHHVQPGLAFCPNIMFLSCILLDTAQSLST